MRIRSLLQLGAVLLLAALGGCAVGPAYPPPPDYGPVVVNPGPVVVDPGPVVVDTGYGEYDPVLGYYVWIGPVPIFGSPAWYIYDRGFREHGWYDRGHGGWHDGHGGWGRGPGLGHEPGRFPGNPGVGHEPGRFPGNPGVGHQPPRGTGGFPGGGRRGGRVVAPRASHAGAARPHGR
jgi:hypothetical protein